MILYLHWRFLKSEHVVVCPLFDVFVISSSFISDSSPSPNLVADLTKSISVTVICRNGKDDAFGSTLTATFPSYLKITVRKLYSLALIYSMSFSPSPPLPLSSRFQLASLPVQCAGTARLLATPPLPAPLSHFSCAHWNLYVVCYLMWGDTGGGGGGGRE